MMQRPITSGSRQAPDPYDKFLEERDLYRKHTARDASSLFRVIAEQMYDTQMLHAEVRQECVKYMRKNRLIFEQSVHGSFENYLSELSKSKSVGTLLELRALAFLYKRNVLLYQPYDLGNCFIVQGDFTNTIRIFYTNDCHFDSVFLTSHIQEAAMCQSICFDLLYRMHFKLPDIDLAVEKMLHPYTFKWGESRAFFNVKGYLERLVTADGRTFELDLPQNTTCILDSYKRCNFHNNIETELLIRKTNECGYDCDNYGDNDGENDGDDDGKTVNEDGNDIITDVSESDIEKSVLQCNDILLPHRLISCVRQLLNDGITPFPYKVAKSLDPNMYRNIEFDCWNEMRKEARRSSIYNADFLIGSKCFVRLQADQNELYICHIQEMSKDKNNYVVYVEKLGEKHVVPYEALSPLPINESKPWVITDRLQCQMRKFPFGKYFPKSRSFWKRGGKYFNKNEMHFKGIKNGYTGELIMDLQYQKCKSYLNYDHFCPLPMEFLAYPLCSIPVQNDKNDDHNSDASIENHNVDPDTAAFAFETNASQEAFNLSGSVGGENLFLLHGQQIQSEEMYQKFGGEAGVVDDNDNYAAGTEHQTKLLPQNNILIPPPLHILGITPPVFAPMSSPFIGPPPFIAQTPGVSPSIIGASFRAPAPPTFLPIIRGPTPVLQTSYSHVTHPSALLQLRPSYNYCVSSPPNPNVQSEFLVPTPPPSYSETEQSYGFNPRNETNAINFSQAFRGSGSSSNTNYCGRSMNLSQSASHCSQQYDLNNLSLNEVLTTTSMHQNHDLSSTEINQQNDPINRNGDGGYNGISANIVNNGRINTSLRHSIKINGQDLPCDMTTLRHFFNMGVDYHQLLIEGRVSISPSRSSSPLERRDICDDAERNYLESEILFDNSPRWIPPVNFLPRASNMHHNRFNGTNFIRPRGGGSNNYFARNFDEQPQRLQRFNNNTSNFNQSSPVENSNPFFDVNISARRTIPSSENCHIMNRGQYEAHRISSNSSNRNESYQHLQKHHRQSSKLNNDEAGHATINASLTSVPKSSPQSLENSLILNVEAAACIYPVDENCELMQVLTLLNDFVASNWDNGAMPPFKSTIINNNDKKIFTKIKQRDQKLLLYSMT